MEPVRKKHEIKGRKGKKMSKTAYVYEIREIDSMYYIDGWQWNTSYNIGHFVTKAKDEKRAFIRALNKQGVFFKKNKTIIYSDGDILEVQDRKTKQPLYAAMFLYTIEGGKIK